MTLSFQAPGASTVSPSVHLHIISMHTSPLAQAGQGDAGGMNVYIDRSLRALLAHYPWLSVEIFTLARERTKASSEQVSERALIHFIDVQEGLGAQKSDLPALVPAFAREVGRRARRRPDIVHSHYWLSGLAALEYSPHTPLIHTMHTTAAAKDARSGPDEAKEPRHRFEGELRIVRECTALVVNTEVERNQMIDFYGAVAEKIHVIEPGVDTGIFKPVEGEQAAHAGSDRQAHLVFAGRPQSLKGPQILIEALALLPSDLEVSLTIIGKSGTDFEAGLLQRARELSLDRAVELIEPLAPRRLAQHFRAGDIVACPSSSETFGLVALEAQACGTPVIATAADGLTSAVAHEESGILVPSRDPAQWAEVIEGLVRDPNLRARLGRQAAARASEKTWVRTAAQLSCLYQDLVNRP